MRREEFYRFVDEVMAPLYLLMREKPDAAVMHAYFARLARWPLAIVKAAVERVTDRATFFPKIAEIITAIEGTVEDRAALAWGLVHQAALKGFGGYSWITFEDPVIAPVVQAMGGWTALYSLGFGVESVEVATARKEFLQLYGALSHGGVSPPEEPVKLCARPALSENRTTAITPALLAAEHRALVAETEVKALTTPAGERIDIDAEWPKLVATLQERAMLAPARRLIVIDKPARVPPTAAELAEHERKKRAALEMFAAGAEGGAR